MQRFKKFELPMQKKKCDLKIQQILVVHENRLDSIVVVSSLLSRTNRLHLRDSFCCKNLGPGK